MKMQWRVLRNPKVIQIGIAQNFQLVIGSLGPTTTKLRQLIRTLLSVLARE